MPTEIVFGIVFSMLLALDIVGNTLVIIVVCNNRAMKTPMNYLLLNLAVADITVGTFFAPHFLFDNFFAHPTGTLGNVLCKALTGTLFSWVGSLVSGFILVSVAVERFYAVVHPTSFRHKITTRKLKRIVPACWIIAIIHVVPALVYKSVDVNDPEKNVCRTTFAEHWHYVTHDLLWLTSSGIIPTVVMTVLYSRVLYTLWMTDNGNATNLAVIKARKRITQKSITVSIIYALCVVPVNTVYLLSTLYPETFSLHDTFFEGATCLVVLNSTVNPFVYTFQCKKFRKYFKRLLCRASTTTGSAS